MVGLVEYSLILPFMYFAIYSYISEFSWVRPEVFRQRIFSPKIFFYFSNSYIYLRTFNNVHLPSPNRNSTRTRSYLIKASYVQYKPAGVSTISATVAVVSCGNSLPPPPVRIRDNLR